jgi:hypothetical protein
MANSRPVRIVRAPVRAGERAVRVPLPRPTPAETAVPSARFLDNGGAVQRANRLSIAYAAALLVVYAILGLYARSAPGGTSPGANSGLEIFAVVAVVLAGVGIVLTLGSAPRRVELGPDGTVFVGRLGNRLRLPPIDELSVRVVRRFPGGWLSSVPVAHVEVAPRRKGRTRSFLVEEHMFDESGPAAGRRAD